MLNSTRFVLQSVLSFALVFMQAAHAYPTSAIQSSADVKQAAEFTQFAYAGQFTPLPDMQSSEFPPIPAVVDICEGFADPSGCRAYCELHNCVGSSEQVCEGYRRFERESSRSGLFPCDPGFGEVEDVLVIRSDLFSGRVGQDFTLTARLASGVATAFEWTTSDGQTASGETASFEFLTPGAVSVTAIAGGLAQTIDLLVFDSDGRLPGVPQASKPGDADQNGIVDLADVLVAQQVVANLVPPLSEDGELNADLTYDGILTEEDVDLLADTVLVSEPMPTGISPSAAAPLSAASSPQSNALNQTV